MLAECSQIEQDLEHLADGHHLLSARDVALDLSSLLLPPEEISTRECAAKYRYLPNPEGTGKRLYDPALTPYMNGPQDALDDREHKFVVVVGPARTGKSIAGENHLFKRLRHGPLTDTIIYLPGKSDVDSYADKEFADFFTLHPEIEAKLGRRATDNKREFKRVSGRAIQLFPANSNTVRQKQAPLIMATEIDGYRKALRSAMKDLIALRGRSYGNQFKGYLESHPDAGWAGGIATFWQDSTQGLWYWPCPHCDAWSSPHPIAPRGMTMRLDYERAPDLDEVAMLNKVEQTACLVCPHCGAALGDSDKPAMLSAGRWVFSGETIDVDGTVKGSPVQSETAGFWIHGTMSPFVPLGTLAREYVAALVFFERTRQPQKLREVTVKAIGTVYGGTSGGALQASELEERAKASEGFRIGTAPAEVMFVTAAVDVGHRKFDVGIWGWDLEGRSWLIDRYTITSRTWVDGTVRDIRPAERIDDWHVLDPLIDRMIPIGEGNVAIPVAAVAIDTGDGHVTEKAREYARRMARKNKAWGAAKWQKVRLIKGAKSRMAPEIPVKPRKVSLDERGQEVLPIVDEWDLGVHRLKTLSIERLAVDDGGPGQCYFATGIPKSVFEEFVGERLVDDEWQRTGPNESLDLFGYAEAVRLMLKPDRADIKWDTRPPAWARPVQRREIASPDSNAVPASTRTTGFLDKLAAMGG